MNSSVDISVRDSLEFLLAGHTLSRARAGDLLRRVACGEVNPGQLAALFSIYRFRSPSIEEIEGFRAAMLEVCEPLNLAAFNPTDLCGTGGDGKNTFNVSTASAFVVAACGITVAKHGNYSFSSTSGSSNVLEVLGVKLSDNRDYLTKCIEQSGVCFIHAPLFHSAFKGVQATRRELGIRTFLNLLGPLVNPARPTRQVVGVYDLEVCRLYRSVLQRAGGDFRIVHSFDGYDEISLTGQMRITSPSAVRDVVAMDFGLKVAVAEELIAPQTILACAKLLERVLTGEATRSQIDVVVANSAVAIQLADPSISLCDASMRAEDAIISGKAMKCLKEIREIGSSVQ